MTVAPFVEGATVELVGPNKPLPPKMIQSVAKDGPLHPEVDKILNFLARGFAVIGLRKKQKGSDPSLGAYETETDDNGWFKLAAAPGIYSVRAPLRPNLCFPSTPATLQVISHPIPYRYWATSPTTIRSRLRRCCARRTTSRMHGSFSIRTSPAA